MIIQEFQDRGDFSIDVERRKLSVWLFAIDEMPWEYRSGFLGVDDGPGPAPVHVLLRQGFYNHSPSRRYYLHSH